MILRKSGQKFETQQIKDVYSFRKSKAEIADEEDYARRVACYEKMKKEQIERAKKEAAEKKAKEKSQVAVPGESAVVNAKEWVDNGSRL